jgi:hypothetical protein
MKCKYYEKCMYYYKQSFTCHTYQNESYCGKYREFIYKEKILFLIIMLK